jgi:hypothetical protein
MKVLERHEKHFLNTPIDINLHQTAGGVLIAECGHATNIDAIINSIDADSALSVLKNGKHIAVVKKL